MIDDYGDSKIEQRKEETESERMRRELPLPTRKENINNLASYLDKANNRVIPLANIEQACFCEYDPNPASDDPS